MLTNIILTFIGVALVTYGLMSYISGIVRFVITRKLSFSKMHGIIIIGMISLGIAILLNI